MQKLLFHLLLLPFMFITENTFSQKKTLPQLKWATIAKLPNASGEPSLGFAGAINGFTAQVFVVAGGANFPDKMPWEHGQKYYSNQLQILQKTGNSWQWNNKAKRELPEAIAYCGNTATPLGLVYAGGENERGLSNKAFLLKWDTITEDIVVKPLPNLPIAVSNLALTNIGNIVYAAGGDEQSNSSNQFHYLNLDCENPSWKALPNLPIALANAVVVSQYHNNEKYIYVIGGRSKNKNGISDLHHTTFAFDTKHNIWRTFAPITNGANITNLSAAAGVAIGKNYILIPGSDDGKMFHQIETYISAISQAKTEEEKNSLIAKKNNLVINHKGFNKSVLLYNTITNKWQKIGELPFFAPVTTTASKYGNDIILSNGEIRPGVRTPDIMLGKLIF